MKSLLADAERDRLIAAILPDVPFDGWSQHALRVAAERIGVPVETVRNWEQGKRSPRGPARALLKVIDKVPDVAFAVLRRDGRQTADDAGQTATGRLRVSTSI